MKYLQLLVLTLLSTCIIAEKPIQKLPKNYDLVMVFPLLKQNNSKLSFQIPKSFKLANDKKELEENAPLFLEFIPNKETLESWNTIITISQIPGNAKGYKQYVKDEINTIKSHPNASEVKLNSGLDLKTHNVKHFKQNISYKNTNLNRKEHLHVVSFQADNDIWIVQCTNINTDFCKKFIESIKIDISNAKEPSL